MDVTFFCLPANRKIGSPLNFPHLSNLLKAKGPNQTLSFKSLNWRKSLCIFDEVANQWWNSGVKLFPPMLKRVYLRHTIPLPVRGWKDGIRRTVDKQGEVNI